MNSHYCRSHILRFLLLFTMHDMKWNDEAVGVINDIKTLVKYVDVCKQQPNIEEMVLLNMETFENDQFCIKLCALGFGVVGNRYDHEDKDVDKWYETPYAMLLDLSPGYADRFNQLLSENLQRLPNGKT